MSLLPLSLNPSKTLIGHNQDENQVSSTSSSCLRSFSLNSKSVYCFLKSIIASDEVRVTTVLPFGSYQAGIRCPPEGLRSGRGPHPPHPQVSPRPQVHPGRPHRERWPGRADGLGDRLRTKEGTTSTTIITSCNGCR